MHVSSLYSSCEHYFCCISSRSPLSKVREAKKREILINLNCVKELLWGKPNLWKSLRSINHQLPNGATLQTFSHFIIIHDWLIAQIEKLPWRKITWNLPLRNRPRFSFQMWSICQICWRNPPVFSCPWEWEAECPIPAQSPPSSVHTK